MRYRVNRAGAVDGTFQASATSARGFDVFPHRFEGSDHNPVLPLAAICLSCASLGPWELLAAAGGVAGVLAAFGVGVGAVD